MPPAYQAFGFPPSNVDISLPELRDAFAARLPAARVELAGGTVRIVWPGFELEVTLAEGAHVLEEAREIASVFPLGIVDRAKIATCARRFEIASIGDDPEMQHFNDYAIAIETLQEVVRGIVAWDPQSGEVI
jgi:hypothetical protein